MESPDFLERLRAACAMPLQHPDGDTLRQACFQIVDFALDEFTALDNRAVGASPTRSLMEALLHEPLPEYGESFAQVLHEFRTAVAPNALRSNHPRFLAFVPGAPSFPSMLGDWLCSAMNVAAAAWKEAAGPAQVELVVLDWFRQILGYPPEAAGLLTGGGSEAILTALVTAREALRFEDRPHAVLYASEQRHWSVDRAARVAGFRSDQVRLLPVDAAQRLVVAGLTRAVAEDALAGRLPWMVVASAGTTNTGAIDPLDALADFCKEARLWLHVDAAYGWAAALTADGLRLLRGIERADSISLDPHKWFAQTYDVGCLLVRHGSALAATFAMQPEYLQDVVPNEDEVNFADRGMALTRRFRALKIWFSLKVLGLGWHRRLVEHCCNLAALAERLLESAGRFEIVSRRQLSVVCFRLVPPGPPWCGAELDALNRRLGAEASATGRMFIATTRVSGAVALRACFVNWRTTAADVAEVVHLLIQAAQRVIGERAS